MVTFLLTACGAAPPEPKPLCAGTAGAHPRVALEARAPVERLGRGLALLFDNGGPYVFVDAGCTFWVSNPAQVWDETRSGELDEETALRLGMTLHVDAWPRLGATWTDPGGRVFDAPTLVFDDAEHAVVCVDFCDAPGVPKEVKEMRDAMAGVAQELWDAGSPTDSSLRALAIPTERFQGVPFVAWPLGRPISDFVRAGDVGFGEGTLEEDAASVKALKELRASFLRGDHGAFVWNMLPVESGGAYYQLYMRDTLPFEDARGLVPLTIDLDGT